MTLQAWFDDSGTKGTGRWMAMAGLFGNAEVFAAISDDWDRHLRAEHPGRIRYFKMDEACSLNGESRHWREENRDAKVLQLAHRIDRADLLGITARVDLSAFESVAEKWEHVKPRPGDEQRHHSMGQPYLLLFQYVLVTVVTEAVERGVTSPIEIIFDEQSLFRPTILSGYDELRNDEIIPERRGVMPIQPWFRDDRNFVVLQAADMLAGESRLVAENHENNPSFIGALCPNLTVLRKDIGVSEMKDLHTHLEDQLGRDP